MERQMSEDKKVWETKDLSGSAFPNRRKMKDTHADYVGEARVPAPGLYWMNIWAKTTKGGEVYLSVTFNPKEEKGASSSMKVEVKTNSVIPAQPVQQAAIDDDSIPF
jgi:hypothetical protein